ncbi:MAG: Na+/H+ antiporter subunit E [Casimicrobiaceae bacterium]
MKPMLPYPVLSAIMVLGWLSLTELSMAQLVLGIILAVAIPRLAYAFLKGLPRVRAIRPAIGLAGRVAWDIILSNLAVARGILGPSARLSPAFVEVPLILTHPHAITLLATIITMTPGTLSAGLGPDARTLLVHALDADDPDALVAGIKANYERPLKEIFEC